MAEVGGTAGSYVVGDTVRFTTAVQNLGDAAGDASTYSFVLPSGLELVANSLTIADSSRTNSSTQNVVQPTYDSTSRTIRASLGDRTTASTSAGGRLAPGSTATVTFQAVIQSSAASSTLNYAPTVRTTSAVAPTWPIDVNPTNVAISVAAPSADVAVSALTTPLNATAGSATTWTFRATNNGPSEASGVSATLTIPSELTSVAVRYSASNDAATSPITCTVSGTTATCPIGSIPSGQIRRFWVTGTIPANYVATTNPRTMTVTGTTTATSSDPVSSNNTLAYNATVATGPTVPTNLRTNGTVTRTSVPLIWNVSTAAAGIGGYQVYRDGTTLVCTVTGTANTCTATNTGGAGSHFFQVRALDTDGRASGYSSPQLTLTIP